MIPVYLSSIDFYSINDDSCSIAKGQSKRTMKDDGKGDGSRDLDLWGTAHRPGNPFVGNIINSLQCDFLGTSGMSFFSLLSCPPGACIRIVVALKRNTSHIALEG